MPLHATENFVTGSTLTTLTASAALFSGTNSPVLQVIGSTSVSGALTASVARFSSASIGASGTFSGAFSQGLTPNNSATLNSSTGRFVWVATSATFALTSSCILSSSIIHLTKETDDATFAYVKNVSPAAGNALITPNASPTANTTCSFIVFNGP